MQGEVIGVILVKGILIGDNAVAIAVILRAYQNGNHRCLARGHGLSHINLRITDHLDRTVLIRLVSIDPIVAVLDPQALALKRRNIEQGRSNVVIVQNVVGLLRREGNRVHISGVYNIGHKAIGAGACNGGGLADVHREEVTDGGVLYAGIFTLGIHVVLPGADVLLCEESIHIIHFLCHTAAAGADAVPCSGFFNPSHNIAVEVIAGTEHPAHSAQMLSYFIVKGRGRNRAIANQLAAVIHGNFAGRRHDGAVILHFGGLRPLAVIGNRIVDCAGGGDDIGAGFVEGEGDLAVFIGRHALQRGEAAFLPGADLHPGQRRALLIGEGQGVVQTHRGGNRTLIKGGVLVGVVGVILVDGGVKLVFGLHGRLANIDGQRGAVEVEQRIRGLHAPQLGNGQAVLRGGGGVTVGGQQAAVGSKQSLIIGQRAVAVHVHHGDGGAGHGIAIFIRRQNAFIVDRQGDLDTRRANLEASHGTGAGVGHAINGGSGYDIVIGNTDGFLAGVVGGAGTHFGIGIIHGIIGAGIPLVTDAGTGGELGGCAACRYIGTNGYRQPGDTPVALARKILRLQVRAELKCPALGSGPFRYGFLRGRDAAHCCF